MLYLRPPLLTIYLTNHKKNEAKSGPELLIRTLKS